MGNLHLANVVELLNGAWPILLIGLGTAGLAFVVGWTTMRRRKVQPAAVAASGGPVAASPDPFTVGAGNERRSAARRGGHAITVDMTDPDEKTPPQQGWVMDRSAGGVCLMMPHPVPAGSFWKVRPAEAPRTTPPVRVQVKICVAVGGEWKLNCQFEKTPSYAVLLMFG